MSPSLLIFCLFYATNLLADVCQRRWPRAGNSLRMLVPALTVAAAVIAAWRHPEWFSSLDAIGQASLFVGLAAAVVGSCLLAHSQRGGQLLSNAGLLILCGGTDQALLLWLAVLGSGFSTRLSDADSDHILWSVVTDPTRIIGCLTLIAGGLLWHLLPESRFAVLFFSLILAGLGGMFGWFPFPRTETASDRESSAIEAFADRSLPLMTAGIFLYRTLVGSPGTMPVAFLAAGVGIYGLGISTARLLRTDRFSQRVTLASINTLCFLILAAAIAQWEARHPLRDWTSSNVPHADLLCAAILLCEAAGLLMLVSGAQLLMPNKTQGADYLDVVAGSAERRPAATAATLAGSFSLAGLPPCPGFWWRLALVISCLLPHEQSSITRMIEPHAGFSLLMLSILGLWIVGALGELQVFQRLVFVEPFRVRAAPLSWQLILGGVLSALIFLWVTLHPLSGLTGFLPIISSPSA